METREITCINCPMGCALQVEIENGEVTQVTGNACPRGPLYAQKEVSAPRRTVTGTVCITGAVDEVVSCKTYPDIPKEMIGAVADAMSRVVVEAPVAIGDVLVENIANTGSNLVATHSLDARA